MLKRVLYGLLLLAVVLVVVGVRSARQSTQLDPEGAEESARSGVPEAVAAPSEPEYDPDVAALLREGRPWHAARRMRNYLRQRGDAPPEAVLLAARAEAGWGSWERVRTLLDGKPWLDRTRGGEGWFLLGRAREEGKQWRPAAEAYARYLAVAPAQAPERRTAGLVRGRALLQAGRTEAGIAALDSLRDSTPEVSAWAALFAANARAERGDTAGVREEIARIGEAATVAQAQRAYLRAYTQARDPRGARALALGYRQAATSDAARAEWGLAAAHSALAFGDTGQARADVRRSLAAAGAPNLFRSLGGLSTADRLALARAFHRQGSNASAAVEYRAWLASDAGSDEERRNVRLALGRALFAAGRNAEVEPVLRPLAAQSAEALYMTARAQLRLNQRANARTTMLRVADRFRGSAQAADALFLLADLAHDDRELTAARRYYRRLIDEAPRTARAAQARMRLGGLEFLERDYRTAARIWEEGRSVSTGTTWAQATYWAGRAYRAMGDSATASARFREVRAREPLSYYSVQSAVRLNQPYWPIALDSAPQTNPAARERIAQLMRSVDLLRTAGLDDQAEAEATWVVRRVGDDPDLQYPLAEALNARGYTVVGTRLGQQIAERERGTNLRLLRILYPFAYRSVIEAEARSNDLDPFMVAALARQESTFKARISSPVGARGLMQVMPQTGRGLAQGADLGGWDDELLFQPEINVHLGTRFLAAQMRQYSGNLPRVFSAYNAGPTRVERWRRWPEAADQELWTERIPFAETRDYVRILRRNIALYRGLYGS